MSTKRSGQPISQKAALALPVPALGVSDLIVMQIALLEAASDWSVELQGVCADDATLVVLPDGGDDAMGPSFQISRAAHGLQVDQVHWDVVTEVGVYPSLAEVIEALRPRLDFCSGLGAPASATLH
jgi:hypothetical protein